MITWSPVREMDDLKSEINSIFNTFYTPNRWDRRNGRYSNSYPKLNIYEDKDHYFIEAVAPGLDTGKFDISVQDQTVAISGEKAQAPQDENVSVLRSERAFGKFSRTVELPSAINTDKVEAKYQSGILYITVPKAEEAKPKRIEVKVA
jgi:HSP20 family protein